MITATDGTQADFFVHPDYHRLSGREVTKEVRQYETALHDRIEESELPILIYNPGASNTGSFWDHFPSDQRFRSEPNQGYLGPDRAMRNDFNTLLSEQHVLRGLVHGSYLAQCVRYFKGELLARRDTSLIQVQAGLDFGMNSQMILPSAIEYGLVLSKTRIKKSCMPKDYARIPGLPPGKYADNSRVFCVI